MTSGVFSKVCFKRREGSVTLHPFVLKHREGSVTLHPIMHREAPKVFLEFKEPFSSEKGSLPPEALLRKGEQI